ncbi:MAG TPA: immunoglobulin domain-containing protein [Holophagaceae bacterium]|nr:immunoglobulin domain-containing protein [Holophagaceae bacterium]
MQTLRILPAAPKASFVTACLLALLTACGGGGSSSKPAPAAPTAPTFTTAPASMTVVAPAPATFTAAATGGTVTYQWNRNGAPVANATSTSYTTAATSAADDGATFTVTASNATGSVTSSSATLHVNFVALPGQPTTQLAPTGGTATFQVGAQGPVGGTLHYQWRKGGVAMAGATGATLTLTGVGAGDMASYTCDVYSTLNGTTTATVQSAAATLALVDPPVITGQPVSQAIVEGNPVTFSVTATGTALSYQWRIRTASLTADIAGATGPSLTLPSVTEADQASYTCFVSNTQNGATDIRSSLPATLSVVSLPVISTQPVGTTIFPGDPLTLSVAATANGVLSYQWKKGGVAIPGATSATYAVASVTLSDDGTYTCDVTNTKAGTSATVTSQAAVVVVQGAPAITTQPGNRSVIKGQTATFNVVAKGVNLTYAWYKDGVLIPGATSDTYTTPVTVLTDSGSKYKCTVTNSFGSTTSDEATLTVIDVLATFTASTSTLTLGEGVILTYSFRPGTSATLQVGSGTPVAVTSGGNSVQYPSTNTTYTLAVTDGGVTTPFTQSVVVKTYTPKHFYTVNFGDSTIARYPIDLTKSMYFSAAAGSALATGTGPVHVTTSPDEAYLYVANNTGNSISAYSADAATGVLTSLGAPVPLSTYGSPWCSAVNPAGTRLYVACDNGIEVFNLASGAPLAAPGLAYAIPGRVKGDLLMHPSGAYLFVLDNAHAKVIALAIDPATGALTFASSVSTAPNPSGLTFDRSASQLYTRGTDAGTDGNGHAFNAAINVIGMDFNTGVLSQKSKYAGYDINPYFSAAVGYDYYVALVRGRNEAPYRHGLSFSKKPGIDQLFHAYTTETYGLILSVYDVDVPSGTILGDTADPFLETGGSPFFIGNGMIMSPGGENMLDDRSGTVFVYILPDTNQLMVYQSDAQGRIKSLANFSGEIPFTTGANPSHGCFRGTFQ